MSAKNFPKTFFKWNENSSPNFLINLQTPFSMPPQQPSNKISCNPPSNLPPQTSPKKQVTNDSRKCIEKLFFAQEANERASKEKKRQIAMTKVLWKIFFRYGSLFKSRKIFCFRLCAKRRWSTKNRIGRKEKQINKQVDGRRNLCDKKICLIYSFRAQFAFVSGAVAPCRFFFNGVTYAKFSWGSERIMAFVVHKVAGFLCG